MAEFSSDVQWHIVMSESELTGVIAGILMLLGNTGMAADVRSGDIPLTHELFVEVFEMVKQE